MVQVDHPPYRYTGFTAASLPSKPIRLLQLRPGDTNDDLSIALFPVRLAAPLPPKYEALSYVWGKDTGARVPVIVDGHETLQISPTLAVALRHLRHRDAPRNLWIDAVCINQDDLEEQAQQVGQMGAIFQTADKVIVWLGPEADNSSMVFDYFRRWTRVFQVDWKTFTLGLTPEADEDEFGDFLRKETQWHMTTRDGYNVGPDMSALFLRPWFERVWTRQEIFLARPGAAVVQCGSDTLSWDALRLAAFLLGSRDTRFFRDAADPEHAARNVQTIARLRRVYNLAGAHVARHGPMPALQYARWASCTDPRDRVYGVLNMIDPGPGHDALVVPDYNISAAHLYRLVATRYLQRYRSLLPFLYAGMSGSQPSALDDPLPTWVPDWTVADNRGSLRLYPFLDISALLLPDASPVGHSTLRLSGVLVGRLAEYAPSPGASVDLSANPLSLSAEDAAKVIWDMFPDTARTRAAHGTLDAIADAYSKTLAGGRLRDPYAAMPQSIYSDTPSLAEARGCLDDILRGEGHDPNIGKTAASIRFLHSLPALENSIAITDAGRLVMAPKAARLGDLVYAIPGCPGPVVLRPTSAVDNTLDDHRDTFLLVGTAYMDGIMDGEALLGPLPAGHVVQWREYPDDLDATPVFVNTLTGETGRDDPRVDPAGEPSTTWQEVSRRYRAMTPQRLRERGVDIKEVDIV